MITPPWYNKLEKELEVTWPLEVALAISIVGITTFLLLTKKRLLLATWITYMYMP